MALFRDEKEALRRLEEALQEEQEEYEEEYEEDGIDADYAEEDGELDGFAPDVSRIPIRNTDRTDLDPEELTEQLHKSENRRTAAAVIALLTIAAVFCGLLWYVLRYR